MTTVLIALASFCVGYLVGILTLALLSASRIEDE